MNRNSLVDYSAYSLLKVLGPLIRALPTGVSFAFGRFLGDLVFFLAFRRRAQVYANIRTAFSGWMSPSQIRRTCRQFFRSFGQNLIEIFLIPTIDDGYMRRHIRVNGLENIKTALGQGKGVLLVSVHAGSWELANILSANLGFPFSMFVRDQKFPLVEGLLNDYRKSKGCRLIQRKDQTRELIRVLKNNESTGLTVDQGGRNGTPVLFFGKEASMSSGAVRLALKYGCALVPVFMSRVKGPELEVTVAEPFRLKRTGDPEKDLSANLQELVRVFEGHISRYPHEYLWSYKVWKYSGERSILILSDGKTGHLRQAQSLAGIAGRVFAERGLKAVTSTVEVRYRSDLHRRMAAPLNFLSGRHICRGCLLCLRVFLEPASYQALVRAKQDLIISCGSSLSAPNYILSRENNCRSFLIMRPSLAALNRFDLVVMPKHDRPAAARNVAVVSGALNLIDDAYLADQARQLRQAVPLRGGKPVIGLLLGGDADRFRLDAGAVGEVCRQVKEAAARLDAELLVTTSRRTSADVEQSVGSELSSANLLVIANRVNVPYAVGGILGTSAVVVCSPESISMISEAASSGAYVVVFDLPGLGSRHRRFLKELEKGAHITLVEPGSVASVIGETFHARPRREALGDRETVLRAVRKAL